MSVKELAQRIGQAPTTIYDLERGDKKASTKVAEIAQVLRVDSLWLQTGRGEMRNSVTPSSTALTDDEQKLLGYFRFMNPETQQAFIGHAIILRTLSMSKNKAAAAVSFDPPNAQNKKTRSKQNG